MIVYEKPDTYRGTIEVYRVEIGMALDFGGVR